MALTAQMLCLALVLLCLPGCDSFQAVHRCIMTTQKFSSISAKSVLEFARTPKLMARGSWGVLRMQSEASEEENAAATPPSALKVSYPTPDEGVEMGIREWPGFLKKDSDFVEDVEPGTVRYVLEGKGICTPEGEPGIEMEPGTLLECTDATSLSWKVSTPMVILTPKFEQPGLLAAGALALFGGLGWLLATTQDTKAVKKQKQS